MSSVLQEIFNTDINNEHRLVIKLNENYQFLASSISSGATFNLAPISLEQTSSFNVTANSSNKIYYYNSGVAGVATILSGSCQINQSIPFFKMGSGNLTWTNGVGVNIIKDSGFTEISNQYGMAKIFRLPNSDEGSGILETYVIV